ncbi:hypothetical protein OsI_32712 [Oryza sativa Indica Group]|uniref:Uncharacterized protein n=1 Tax=Oryza sativa subsp. indica TaxID=39946 RepID=B8BFP5_ORYSI|nr:hypothetical protein OsI_32712 [Oryza sativa Indica Group]
MEAAVRLIHAPQDALKGVGEYIDHALGPAAAVHSLKPPLLAASAVTDDLPGYLNMLSRFEEALHFLSDNCGIASQWLTDIVEYLKDRSLAATLAFSHLTTAAATAYSSPASSPRPTNREGGGCTCRTTVVEGAAINAGPVGVLSEVASQLLLPLPTLFPRGSSRTVGPSGSSHQHRREQGFGEETGVQVREDATAQAEQETDVGESTLWSMRRPARKASMEETVTVVVAESVAASAFLRGAAFGGAIWGRVGDRSG